MVAGKVKLAMGLQRSPSTTPKPPPSPSPASGAKQHKSNVFNRSFGVYFPRASAQVQPRPPDVSELLAIVEDLRERESRLKTELVEQKLLRQTAAIVPLLEADIVSKDEEIRMLVKKVVELEGENEKLVREREMIKAEKDVKVAKLEAELLMSSSQRMIVKNSSFRKAKEAPKLREEVPVVELERPSISASAIVVRSRVPRVPKPPPKRSSSDSSISSSSSSLSEGRISTDSVSAPPPPPPPPPMVKCGIAPPPPPPLPPKGPKAGSAKVKRVPEVVEFYHSLMRRDSRRESGPGTVETTAANARDLVGEIENRSSYLIAAKEAPKLREEVPVVELERPSISASAIVVRSRVPRVPKPPPKRSSSDSSISSSSSSLSEGRISTDSVSAPPPPPPPPPMVKCGIAPPPPPPLPPKGPKAGSAKVKRVPEVVEFYHSLMRRDSRRESGPGTVETTAANARDLVGEIENRSSYLIAIKTDVETQGDFIRLLIKEVQNASFSDIEEVLSFVKWLDDELSYLVDERAVLKHFDWPEKKADALREAAFEYSDLKKLECEASSFREDARHTCSSALKKIQTLLEKLEHAAYNLSRLRESAVNRFKSFQIPIEWMLDTGFVSQIKLASVKLAMKYMKRVSAELEGVGGLPDEEELIVQGVRFAFRVHQFAGGFDVETMRAFEELRDKARPFHIQCQNQQQQQQQH